ncbi:hypothetical protein AK812_SmicGene38833 [Symbiodinium microadriaticum]|uniref:Uncharacterized protein n=1 Tax=Symbiodinium microadriaticum TaxID=2951 RepID=A0A1Q9CCR6_SYMMI|nr:hypothetical protein AK812_SmicGene38833 [Symbiodinium microadriaticum]
MLHYCAECVEEPAVVELIGLLATDVDRKDDNGFRPIDYARQTGREPIIQMLEKLRKIHKKLASGVKVGEKEPEKKETSVREVSVKTPEKEAAPRDRFGTRSQSVVKVKADADVRQQLHEATDMNRQDDVQKDVTGARILKPGRSSAEPVAARARKALATSRASSANAVLQLLM